MHSLKSLRILKTSRKGHAVEHSLHLERYVTASVAITLIGSLQMV